MLIMSDFYLLYVKVMWDHRNPTNDLFYGRGFCPMGSDPNLSDGQSAPSDLNFD